MRSWAVFCLLTWMACATDTDEVAHDDISSAAQVDSLSPSSTDAEIMEHLYQAELDQTATDAVATHFPTLSRERAYAIQKLRLAHREQSSRRVGWKVGWSRWANREDKLDPAVGHVMEDRVFPESEPLSTQYFTEGTARAEPEVVFYLNQDLPGPNVSAEEVAAAVESVGVAMEFVSMRVAQPHERVHGIADNVYGAGVVLGAQRSKLDEVDFSVEIGQVEVNGTIEQEGPASDIMGKDPFEALVWTANELIKYGMHLHAGDFVVTGTVSVPPPVQAGDNARVIFTNLGSVSVDFVEQPSASAPAEAEWITLFAGTDLNQFDQLGDAQWNLIDDYVEADGYKLSYLVTKESYGDFQLKVEFWPSPDANSGVYIRCQNPAEVKAESGYEINIYDTNKNPDNRTGAIIHFTAPLTTIEAGGHWNTYEITAKGSHIVVHLNGTLVAELEDESYATGPIALQNNGGLIRFRNVQVKRL